MQNIKKYFMTLALLITAVGGAWAQETETLLTTITATGKGSYSETTPGVVTVTHDNDNFDSDYGWLWWFQPGSLTVVAKEGYTITKCVFNQPYDKTFTVSTSPFKINFIYHEERETYYCEGTDPNEGMNGVASIEVYGTAPAPAEPDVEVTTNAASEGATFTEASFKMPTFDATVSYTLVRDMQDEANPVSFSGLPTNDEPIVVKKGDDGKYQPAETLTLQLIDPLAAAEAQNIIAADGINVKVGKMVEMEGLEGHRQFDETTAVTLDAFLADMKPGTYKMKATATDENSPYDGIVYSSQFTVVEQYDLTVKPASDFSKNGLDAVTVGTQTVTIDANTGEATKTGIAPDTEVKLKAKRGYVIEKVEAKKPVQN